MGFTTVNIVYDGHCGFCTHSLRVVRALDLFGVLRLYDSHDSETYRPFPHLCNANVDEAMYTLVDGKPPCEGFFAFRRLIWGSPLSWLLIPVLYFTTPGWRGTDRDSVVAQKFATSLLARMRKAPDRQLER